MIRVFAMTLDFSVTLCGRSSMKFRISQHARQEMQRRQIPAELLDRVLADPQQIVPERTGRKAYQSQLDFGAGKIYLLRAIVDDRKAPPVVITVYRTSRINKYWATP
jgi:hypothetical protein